MKKKKFTIGLAVIAVLLLLGYWRYDHYIKTPVDPTDSTIISFQIKKGQTAKEIGKMLKENILIKSSLSFSLYSRLHDLDGNIVYGRFALNKTMTIPQIIETISDPSMAEAVLTIQEGITIKDIEEKLADLGLINKDDLKSAVKEFSGWEYYTTFLNQDDLKNLDLPLEGYIYPDTYFLDSESFQPHDIVYLALDNFEKKWLEIGATPQNSKLSTYSIHEIITMASVIENEVFGKENREIVSGILWKRLENNWPLGADATLLYITEDRIITAEDLETDSPYNTRKFQGLPPGPIGNPSKESIEAALFPKESDYWFYLTTKDTGEIIYSKTNEEHNSNREKYL
ncbi:MAG: endolytic transglycosylase MltG [Candidatus Peregrinibacteria bacterium]